MRIRRTILAPAILAIGTASALVAAPVAAFAAPAAPSLSIYHGSVGTAAPNLTIYHGSVGTVTPNMVIYHG